MNYLRIPTTLNQDLPTAKEIYPMRIAPAMNSPEYPAYRKQHSYDGNVLTALVVGAFEESFSATQDGRWILTCTVGAIGLAAQGHGIDFDRACTMDRPVLLHGLWQVAYESLRALEMPEKLDNSLKRLIVPFRLDDDWKTDLMLRWEPVMSYSPYMRSKCSHDQLQHEVIKQGPGYDKFDEEEQKWLRQLVGGFKPMIVELEAKVLKRYLW
ncbi:MAG TPA: hypothetical protein VMQ44_03245 [Candidatus Saccharimonadales bacterium]|nr:hypothetical protein [Candidatus Saccharimonadales bacterium]